MTLTSRVSTFFLGWLGLSLAGFAAGVFLVVRADLFQRTDDRLAATLAALAAAAEIDPAGVEWEPHERDLPRGPDGPLWLVAAPDGGVVDRSADPAEWLRAEAGRPPHRRSVVTLSDPDGRRWRVTRRPVAGPAAAGPVPVRSGEIRYPALELVAALPEDPIRRELAGLAGWLAALTVSLWLTAALVGRRLCRRTLAPVADMAAAARTLGPTAPGERLNVRPTGDELEDLGRAFNAALDRLEEAFERQRRFTGDASHQLRTPLAAMLGQAEVALRRDRDPAEYRDTLRALAGEARRLHRLTESLLFLARADADAASPDLQPVDLPAWATGHVDRWREQHPGVRVHVVVDGPPAPARAHPELLAQLLDNLLDNAAKYGPPDGPVTVRIRRREGGVELAVADSGPGIDPADLPHVFDPFFRAPAARTAGVPGVGLGLSVARRVAESMGARLTVESVVGQGSRFAVWFPAIITRPVPAEPAQSVNSAQTGDR